MFTNLCDYWIVVDNSVEPYSIIAIGNNDANIKVKNKDSWMKIIDLSNGR